MIEISDEVAAALAAGEPVVALESTIIAHGLPRPDNLRLADELEAAVRCGGAVPATVAVAGGRVHVGLASALLERIALEDGVDKVSLRDLGPALARGGLGATTVASTAHVAALAGIAVFATGGLGGVHREASATFDESADLAALAAAPVVVVCAGVKSILDTGATLERLESLSVPVVGYRTDRVAGFYLADSGYPAPWRADAPEEIAAMQRARRELRLPQALVVANPLPAEEQMDPALHDRVLAEALAAAEAAGANGKAMTPFVLGHFHTSTGGESLRANVALAVRNARLGAAVAAAVAEVP